MITEKDLHEAIAECQGERNPNANTCIKLAAYYTILNEISRKDYPEMKMSSGDPMPITSDRIYIESDSEFAQIVNGMNPQEVWPLMNELMETLNMVNPRLYASVIRRLE